MVQVKLAEIVDAFESVSIENREFVNRETGEVVSILNEFLDQAEAEKPYDHLPEWQQEMMEKAYEIIENEDLFVGINSFDINEYGMMEQFCWSLTDPKKEEMLSDAIRGSGAFRRFKDMIHDLGIAEDWYDFRDESFKQLAKEFCERHGFTYG